jgi:hypothetical protein
MLLLVNCVHAYSILQKFPDAFLSHCWGPDELERDNHARVRVINKALQAMGTTTWFDEEKMEGNVTVSVPLHIIFLILNGVAIILLQFLLILWVTCHPRLQWQKELTPVQQCWFL